MISDESDEDADSIDDDDLVETYLAPEISKNDAAQREGGTDGGAPMRDWPPCGGRSHGLDLDPQTLAWFRANHAEWRPEIEGVLRGWVIARRKSPIS